MEEGLRQRVWLPRLRDTRHKGHGHITFHHGDTYTARIKKTYGSLVCDIMPQKVEEHRVRLTVGGDRIDYPGETATKNADLTMLKCL
jgi:hypothetical protein